MTKLDIRIKLLSMTAKQAQNLLQDLRKSLDHEDYCVDIYVSIKGVGSKSFKSCAYFETDRWLFVWLKDESFVLDRKKIGDFVMASPKESVINVRKETCY